MALKIPPALIMLISALIMWLLAKGVHLAGFIAPMWLVIITAVAGAAVMAAGVREFAKARTTLNPLRPEHTSSVVSTGIYRYTRNPMYLGMALMLIAWALYLGQAVAILGVAMFVLYITYMQIIPEERILMHKFAESYGDYCRAVRRWV